MSSCFLALWPDTATLARLVARRDGISWQVGAKVSPDDRLHLTLMFIPRIERVRIAELVEQLRSVRCGEIEADLTWLDVWLPDVAVLRPAVVPTALADLHKKLIGRLVEVGAPSHEARSEYRPHVTFARKASQASDPAGQPVRWRSSGFVLAETVPGVGYRIHERFP